VVFALRFTVFSWPGQLTYIAKNLYHLVVVCDGSSRESLRLVRGAKCGTMQDRLQSRALVSPSWSVQNLEENTCSLHHS